VMFRAVGVFSGYLPRDSTTLDVTKKRNHETHETHL